VHFEGIRRTTGMGGRHTHKPLHHGRRLAFLKPYAAGHDPRSENRDDTQILADDHAGIVQDGDRGFVAMPPDGLSDKLASELFARLLLELPEHRRDLQSAYQDGNSEQLERTAHKLLGAVVYCELPELAASLRELKQTTGSGDTGLTGPAFGKAIRLIDDLLACSGYSGT
jgi:HPt (histidine-containing phosphotransfer) domain-containing protein